jgi:hypothetical protein
MLTHKISYITKLILIAPCAFRLMKALCTSSLALTHMLPKIGRSSSSSSKQPWQISKLLRLLHRPSSKGFIIGITPPSTRSRATTVGSLAGPDILLTAAYQEQFHTLSWYQCCLGRITSKWQQAVAAYSKQAHLTMDAANWAPLFIMALWMYTKNVWKFRNQIVHGSDLEESVKIAMATLSEEVNNHYRAFKADTNYVLPCHEHLFTQRSLQQLLVLSYNCITCWVQSVKEARSILQLQGRHLHQTSQRFFSLFHLQHSPDIALSDDDSSYSLSMIASAHTTSTMLTLTSTAYSTNLDNSSDTLSTASTSACLMFFPIYIYIYIIS